MELVRSAIGETLDYTRVHTGRMPQVYVVGGVVADLIHRLAELVDNAISFSPPQSRVEATASQVGKGIVVEITDQGIGMSTDDLERANEMLREPPAFGVATLSADSRMGLFVVSQLGVRHGISVRLTESDYGGLRAIVLVPNSLVVTDVPDADHLPDRFSSGVPAVAGAEEISDESAAKSEANATNHRSLRPQSNSACAAIDSVPVTDVAQSDWTPAQTVTDQPSLESDQTSLHSYPPVGRPSLPRKPEI